MRTLDELGADFDINAEGEIIILPPIGQPIMLRHQSRAYFKKWITEYARAAVIDGIIQDNTKAIAKGEKPRRKDMVGLARYVDTGATCTVLHGKCRSKVPNVPNDLYREVLLSIISGAVRCADRLHAVRLADETVATTALHPTVLDIGKLPSTFSGNASATRMSENRF